MLDVAGKPLQIMAKRFAGQIQTFLDELKNETDNYGSIHNMISQVKQDYSSRFLIELLQNSHDALEENGRVQVILDEDNGQFYIANTGSSFNEENFHSICKLGQSTKDPAISIGNKGIGFKSVLEVTSSPCIYSGPFQEGQFNGFAFQFTPEIYESLFPILVDLFQNERSVSLETIVGYPIFLDDWSSDKIREVKSRLNASHSFREILVKEMGRLSPYSLPLPVSSQDQMVTSLGEKGFVTVVQLPLEDQIVIKKAIDAIHDLDVRSLLFLPKLTEIHFATYSGGLVKEWSYRKKIKKYGHHISEITLFEGDEEATGFYICSQHLTRDSEGFVEALSASSSLPDQWQELKEATVSIAIEKSDAVPTGLFYIYFPTEKRTDLPVSLNGPFYGDMSRTQINTSVPWNAYLVKETGKLIFELANFLGKQNPISRDTLLDLLAFSEKHEELTNDTANLLYSGLDHMLTQIDINLAEWKVIPTDSESCSSLDTIYLIPNWSFLRRLQPKNLESLEVTTLSGIGPIRSENLKLLAELSGCYLEPEISDWARWVEEIADQMLLSKTGIEEWQAFYHEIQHLQTKLPGLTDELKAKKIVLCSDNELHSFSKSTGKILFLPPKNIALKQLHIPVFIKDQLVFLHPEIKVQDEGDVEFFIKKWSEPFEYRKMIQKVVLPAYSNKHASDDELFEMLSWLIAIQHLGEEIEHIPGIEEMLVPCRDGWFRAGEAFASFDWQDEENFPTADSLDLLLTKHHPKWEGKLLKSFADFHKHVQKLSKKKIATFFKAIGVTDYFRIEQGKFVVEGSYSNFRYIYNISIPEVAEPLMKQWAQQEKNPKPNHFYTFQVESWYMPQMDILFSYNEKGDPNLSKVLLASMKNWRKNQWWVAAVSKDRPRIRETGRSLLALLLANTPWLPDQKNEEFYRPSEIVYVEKPEKKHLPLLYVNPEFTAQLQQFEGKMAEYMEILHAAVPTLSIGAKLLTYLAKYFVHCKPEHEQMYKSVYNTTWEYFLDKLKAEKYLEEVPSIDHVLVQTDSGLSLMSTGESFYLVTNDEKGLRNRLLKSKHIKILYAELQKGEVELLRKQYGWKSVHDLKQTIDAKEPSPLGGVPSLCGGNRKWLPSFILSIACYAHGNPMKPDSRNFRQARGTLEQAELYFSKDIVVSLENEHGEIIQSEQVKSVIDHQSKKWYVTDPTLVGTILAEGISELLNTSSLYFPLLAAASKLSSLEASRVERMTILAELGIHEEDITQIEILLDQELPILREKLLPILIAFDISEADLFLQADTIEKLEENLQEALGEKAENILFAARKSSDKETGLILYEQFSLPLSKWNAALTSSMVDRPRVVNELLTISMKEWKATNRSVILTPIRYKVVNDKNKEGYLSALNSWEEWNLPEQWKMEDWVLDEKKVWREAKQWLEQFEVQISKENVIEEIIDLYEETLSPEDIVKWNFDLTKEMAEELLNIALLVAEKQKKQPPTLDATSLIKLAFPDAEVIFQWEKLTEQTVLTSLLENIPLLGKYDSLCDLKKYYGVTAEELKKAEEIRMENRNKERENRRKAARTILVGDQEFEAVEENFSEIWTLLQPLADQMVVHGSFDQPIKNQNKDTRAANIGGQGGRSAGGSGKIVKERLTTEQKLAVGYAGESLVFDRLRTLYTSVTLESWVSGNRRYYNSSEDGLDDSLGYDFHFYANNSEYLIEVKTTQGNYGYFELGPTEAQAAREAYQKEQDGAPVKYRIAFVTDVLTKPGIHILPNPYSHEGQKFYSSIRDAGAQIRFSLT